jgi:hypothetical protein
MVGHAEQLDWDDLGSTNVPKDPAFKQGLEAARGGRAYYAGYSALNIAEVLFDNLKPEELQRLRVFNPRCADTDTSIKFRWNLKSSEAYFASAYERSKSGGGEQL